MFKIIVDRTKNDPMKEWQARAYSIINNWVSDLKQWLVENSYIDSGELKRSWDVSVSFNGLNFTITVTNESSASVNRVAGRGPGKMPPIGILPYPVALTIALKGTKRWQEQKNFLGIDADGNLKPESEIYRWGEELTRRLNTGV